MCPKSSITRRSSGLSYVYFMETDTLRTLWSALTVNAEIVQTDGVVPGVSLFSLFFECGDRFDRILAGKMAARQRLPSRRLLYPTDAYG